MTAFSTGAMHPHTASSNCIDIARIRGDFPILIQTIKGKPLTYLDSAASAQKPRVVIDAMTEAYEKYYANVHRGVHTLSQRATDGFEMAREVVAKFINARSINEVVFVRGATEGINLVAQTFGRATFQAGDEVIISHLEHHSNIVPWQLLRDERGIELKIVPIDEDGQIDLDAYREMLSPRTRFVAMAHVSNALGTILPVNEIIRLAHAAGARVLIDGCQAAPHLSLDMQALDADFYVFSSHKVYGPTGIGVLYGKYDVLESMPPYQGGGDMIASVTFERTTFKKPPFRFEAGTPAIVEAIGLCKAIEYVSSIGMETIHAHEQVLLEYATLRLGNIPSLHILGPRENKAGIVSFVMEGAHPHDIGTILDHCGVAIRAGHHCAQPLMDRMSVPSTARASFGLYNNFDDVDALVSAVESVREIFA